MKAELLRLYWVLVTLFWRRIEAKLEAFKTGTEAMTMPNKAVEWGVRVTDWWKDLRTW